jgi:hypothetical protein
MSAMTNLAFNRPIAAFVLLTFCASVGCSTVRTLTIPKDNAPIDSQSNKAIAQINESGAKKKAEIRTALAGEITPDEAATLVGKRVSFQTADKEQVMTVKQIDYPDVVSKEVRWNFKSRRIDIREVDRAVVLDPCIEAARLRVNPDSILYFDSAPLGGFWAPDELAVAHNLSWSQVETITFVSHERGALEGLGFGLLAGAAVAAVVFLAYRYSDPDDDEIVSPEGVAAAFGFLFAALVPVFGTIRGATDGHKYVYDFEQASDSRDRTQ